MMKRTRHIWSAGIALLAVAAISSETVWASNCGITRPIRVIVGYGPGGGTDSYARILAGSIPEFLDETPMVIINKPGGAQVIAMKQAQSAKPDGHTLQVLAMGGALMATMMRDQGINWFEDFKPIAQFGVTNQALVVQRESGITTANGLLDMIRVSFSKGKKTRWSHPGRGSVSHIGVTAFLAMNNVLDMTQDVPFKGGAETRNALISDEVGFSASGAHTVPPFEDKLVAVGLIAEERDPVVSDIPTLAEQNVPYVPTSSPIVLVAAKAVPDDIVTCLSEAVKKAVDHEAFKLLTKKSEQAIVYRDASETQIYLQKLAAGLEPIVNLVRERLEN